MKKESLLVPLSVALLLGVNNVSVAEENYDIQPDDNIEFKNIQFENLIHNGDGGAIYNEGTIDAVSELTFENNKATSYQINLDEGWNYDPETQKLTGTVNDKPFESNAVKVFDAEKNAWILAYYDEVLHKNVAVGILKEDNNLSKGGAIYNAEEATLGPITNSTFSNNSASYQGGAIYNANPNNDLIIENSTFINNRTERSSMFNVVGGAVANVGNKMTIKNSTFTGNSAVLENNQTLNNENEISKYNSGWGGAIYNEGELNIENSTFENNKAGFGAGAIFHDQSAVNDRALVIKDSKFYNNEANGIFEYSNIVTKGDKSYNIHYTSLPENDSVTSTGGGAILKTGGSALVENSEFISNKSTNGGAIKDDYYDGELSVKNSIFKDNVAKWHKVGTDIEVLNEGSENEEVKEVTYDEYLGDGGAIKTLSNKLDIADSFFEKNISGQAGGAISSEASSLNIDNSTFVSNTSGEGGAIKLGFNNKLNIPAQNIIKNSTFISNIAQTNGGAISSENNLIIENSNFKSNNANYGGAVYSKSSNVQITDTDFINNSAQDRGGAIYHQGDIIITARNKDVKFTGNKAQKGEDIYLQNSTAVINVNDGRQISFDGGISGSGSIYINDNSKNIYENLNATGTVVIDNFVSPDTSSTLSVNVMGGTLKPTKEEYLNGVDLSLADNSTFDLMNGEVGYTKTNTFSSNNAKLKLDMDLSENGGFDLIDGESAIGTINLTEVNMLADMPEGVVAYEIPFDDVGIYDTMTIKTAPMGVNSVTNDYLYTTIVNEEERKAYVARLSDTDNKPIAIDGFTLAVNGSDKVVGNDVTLSNTRVFSAQKDIDITGKNLGQGWTGNLGGQKLTVMGAGNTIKGNNHAGIVVSAGQTLELNDTNILGFKTSSNRQGALTVKDGGVINIKAMNHDVTLGNTRADKGSNPNLLYFDSTNALAVLETNNSKKIVINDPMRSPNASNEVRLRGNGTIAFNDKVEVLTLTNENENTIHNNFINGVTYNLQSGRVAFAKDNYLNGGNTLNFNGGTLDLANNSVGTVNLQALNLNANSNIAVDVDLANKSMDRISAKDYKLNGNFLNVSKMNLLSDAKEDITKILFADDKLKNNVRTSVSNVAYSPIWKYGVGYDKSSGEFTFTRGAGSGVDAYNPAVLASPVAAQLGGYMGMLDTYQNAFTHMEMNMLKPLAVRTAEMNANKYAISDSTPVAYNSNDMNSSGMWFKPYASYDSVRLKNGPKVNNMSYGSFIGGDTSVHQFKNGVRGVFSPYIAYQGSHQSYSGNSIYQNGGTLGFTGSLYKGNFFTGLTAAVGANIAESSTMYGHDDFGMLMTGVATKTGYNFEFENGRFILQPSLMLSYTMVNSFNYTNGAGVSIHSDPLHVLQVAPQVKFVMNTKNGWQPYLTAGMNWNLLDETNVTANMASLPDMSVKPYVQYGVGVQKTMKDRLTGFLQVVLRNGGRNGIAATGGFRYVFGKEKKNRQRV